LLQAKKRYKYSYDATTYKATYTQDTAFAAADYYVNLTSGVYKLVSGTATATKLYLFNSPIDFSVPTDFNPTLGTYQTNADAAFKYNSQAQSAVVEGTAGSIYRSLSSNADYLNQVKTPGSDQTTKANADAYLAKIKSTLASAGTTAGGSLRYDTSVYTAFRDSLLASTLASDAISDGTPGMNLVPYVYFTNDQTNGVYHPFMVIISYGNGADPHGLRDVTRPPGDGIGSGYAGQGVTRFTNRDYYAKKIPMKDYGVVTTPTANTLVKTLWGDVYSTASATVQAANPKDVLNYASTADNGIMINGAVMFPAYSNVLQYSQAAGELSVNGCHVGQGGGGPHCHADGYQSGRGVGMYNDYDYTNKTHPPLIGFGYDGVALFGRYRTTDTAMLGNSTALDTFGGHNHDSMGYHYHAHTGTATAASTGPSAKTYTYTVRYLIKGAYAGAINSIPGCVVAGQC
jgi:hypothetical protein